MLGKIFKLKSTIDVYVAETEEIDKLFLTFSKMTTRERIEIIVGRGVAEFIALLNGKDSVQDILASLGCFHEQEAIALIDFLVSNRLIIESNKELEDPRYKRQISFFDDMFLNRSGAETQQFLSNKKIAILGCGAIGSALAEILLRIGIHNLILVDYKKLTSSHLSRHLFMRLSDIGKPKVVALAEYLKNINQQVNIQAYPEALYPDTDISRWIDSDVDLIINSCDEPYIGHTSLKIGRFAHAKNIPLYVTGGFDAHLMSSGELLYPPYTPCIDCAQQTFIKALGDWKPTYSVIDSQQIVFDTKILPEETTLSDKELSNYIAGGSGGLVMMSGFSASLSAIRIIQFLADDPSFDYRPIRYEYIVNQGEITQFEMHKQEGCHVCNG